MTADELDTAAIRRRLVPPLTGSGQTEFAREVGEALWRLCDALDAARAAGGVQPAPDPNVACSWCQQPIGDADHFAELIHFPCYDERAAAEEAEHDCARLGCPLVDGRLVHR